MFVYIVFYINFSETEVLGVFANEADAQKCVKENGTTYSYYLKREVQ